VTAAFTGSVVEDATLAGLKALSCAVPPEPYITAGMPGAERSDPNHRDVLQAGRLRQALVRLIPGLPQDPLDDAYRTLTRVDAPSLVDRNQAVHRMLVDSVTAEYRRKDGSIAGAQARVIDFDVPARHDWLAVNSSTVSGRAVRVRRARVSAVRPRHAPHRAHRATRRRPTHPAPPGRGHGGTRASARSPAAPAGLRGLRRHVGLVREAPRRCVPVPGAGDRRHVLTAWWLPARRQRTNPTDGLALAH
jgi:hypothetical protein